MEDPSLLNGNDMFFKYKLRYLPLCYFTYPNIIQIPANFFYVYASIKSDPSSSEESAKWGEKNHNHSTINLHMNFPIVNNQLLIIKNNWIVQDNPSLIIHL